MHFLPMNKVCNKSSYKTKTKQVTNHPRYPGIQDLLDIQTDSEIMDCFDKGHALGLRTDGAAIVYNTPRSFPSPSNITSAFPRLSQTKLNFSRDVLAKFPALVR